MDENAKDLMQRLLMLDKAVETIQIGVTISDTEGRIVFTNPADAAMHGYTVEELIGQKANVFAPQALWKPMARTELGKVRSWSRESVNLRKDGSSFPVLITSDVVFDQGGEPMGIITSCQDISDRKAAEEALRESETRYALAVRGAADGIWDWDLQRGAVYYSPRWIEMVGGSGEQVKGVPEDWFGRVHPEDVDRLRHRLDEHLAGRTAHFEDEHRILRSDRSYRWMRTRGLAVRDGEGTPFRMAGSMADITELKVRDPLTGLPNRALLLDRLEHCMARSGRRKDQFAVLFVDLDRFKNVNDSLGHLVGDRLLIAIARRLRGSLRPGDTLARYGGDEFAILLEDLGSSDDVSQVADRIHGALQAPFEIEEREFFISVSIGITLSSPDYLRAEDILGHADLAMYRAKALGGARNVVFDAALREAASEQLRLETDLRRALERDELRVHYQPIVELASGTIVGLEALLRWQAPERGLLMPKDFLQVAEETGLIVPIGAWILDNACRQMARWHHAFPIRPALKISINVSAKQLLQSDFGTVVEDALERTGLDPSTLMLEITESVLVEQRTNVAETLSQLRALGVEICIDDFGTGYSSLGYLQDLPVDTLKIDQSFVHGMAGGGRPVELVKTILQLGSDFGLKVIAEGIETHDQRGSLQRLECRIGQGFSFFRPVDADGITRLLRVEADGCEDEVPQDPQDPRSC